MSYDLFSYFGGEESFSAASETQIQAGKTGNTSKPDSSAEPAPVNVPETGSATTGVFAPDSCSDDTSTGTNDKNIVYLASDRIRAQNNPKEQSGDTCDSNCSQESLNSHDRGSNEDDLTDEDRDTLHDDPEADESAADKAELGGGSGNTEIVVKSDSKLTAGSAEAKKEEKKPVFNHVTYICYAGRKFLITKFFEQELLATLELEDVRKRLEKDFPELSKQRTKMEWDEKENIICPMVTGGKKGASFSQGLKGFFFRSKDLFEKKEPINILAARDGYYEVRENAIGVFVAKSPVVEELEPCREGFKMSLPKIPEYLFSQLVSFFADYAMHEVEVMGVFYWDMKNEEYVLDVPFQNVTKVSIDPSYSEVPLHFIKVAEIHSRNTMEAYFSSVDDEDELGTMLYGVVGRLQKGVYQITYNLCTRAGVGGRFIPIRPNVMIVGNYPENTVNVFDPVSYPDVWHDRVRIIQKPTNIGGN